ncbi:MAG: helix-hairpin-helix domain-containing protein [bacterium]
MPDITKEQIYIILGIIAIVLAGCVVGVYNQNIAAKRSSPISSPSAILVENTGKIEPVSCFVHVSGAVMNEGVYKLNKGDRLIDLIKLSGAASNADLDSVNLAEVLTDGQKVLIPKKAAAVASNERTSAAGGPKQASKIVNINSADEKELDNLPGVGPAMAKKIFDHRSEKGRFSNIEELKEVPGISEKKFEKLKKYISVN